MIWPRELWLMARDIAWWAFHTRPDNRRGLWLEREDGA